MNKGDVSESVDGVRNHEVEFKSYISQKIKQNI
jgi:hypothetical protein